MFHREVPYKRLAFLAGVLLLLLSLYQAFIIVTMPFSGSGDGVSHILLFANFPEACIEVLSAGALTPLAVSILLFGISSSHVKTTYWCLQAAIWLGGISLWFRSDGLYTPVLGVLLPSHFFPWMVLAILCSLFLLLAYKPALKWLARILNDGSGEEKDRDKQEERHS
jgi:hypothetical protein